MQRADLPQLPKERHNRGVERIADQVLNVVAGLPGPDALKVIHRALGEILAAREAELLIDSPDWQAPVNPDLIRRRKGWFSKIARDPEMRDFIHSLKGYHTVDQITGLLQVRFGRDRAASKSSVHRYLQMLWVRRAGK